MIIWIQAGWRADFDVTAVWLDSWSVCWRYAEVFPQTLVSSSFLLSSHTYWPDFLQHTSLEEIRLSSVNHLPPTPHLPPFLWLPQSDPVCSRAYILYICLWHSTQIPLPCTLLHVMHTSWTHLLINVTTSVESSWNGSAELTPPFTELSGNFALSSVKPEFALSLIYEHVGG